MMVRREQNSSIATCKFQVMNVVVHYGKGYCVTKAVTGLWRKCWPPRAGRGRGWPRAIGGGGMGD